MFRNMIRETPFVSDAANEYFSNIKGDAWSSDVSFLSTLRALLAPRMKENDELYLSFSQTNYSEDQLSGLTPSRALSACVGSWIDNRNMIHVHDFRNNVSTASNDAWMKMVEGHFTEKYEGWHRVEKTTAFFRKIFYVLCYINPERRSAVLFVNMLDARRLHYLQCGIFAYLPWYFDPQAGVTEQEMLLIASLKSKTSGDYEAILASMAEAYDFRTARTRRLLRGFETRYEQQQCDRVKRDIQDILRRMETLDNQMADYLRRKRDNENLLMGLEAKIAEGNDDSEIMDYFLRNKQLILENVSGTTLQFIVKTTLDYFDEDLAKRIIENARSMLYSNHGTPYRGQITSDEMKLLMTKIFIDQTMKIHFCAAYQFQLEGTVSPLSGHRYGPECRNCLPNPHIHSYNCMGSYSRVINECLKNHNYIGALEQCIASGKSLNFGDSVVMEAFVSNIYGLSGDKDAHYIESPDGKMLTVKEAVAWIKAEQEAEEAARAAQDEEKKTEEAAENGENY